MTSSIQRTANHINPIFVAADLAPKTTAEKLMQIYEKTDVFPIAGDCSIVHLLQAASRIVVYSGIALFSLIEDLVNGNLFSDASQSRLRSLAVEILAASFFHPLTSLEIPSELVAMFSHAEGLMRDDLTLEQNNAMVKATILKTLVSSNLPLVSRLYSPECPTALPSLRTDLRTLRTHLEGCEHYEAPIVDIDGFIEEIFTAHSNVQVDRSYNAPRVFGQFLKFTRQQLPQFLTNLADSEDFVDERTKLEELSENIDTLFDLITPGNVAQFFELLPDAAGLVEVSCTDTYRNWMSTTDAVEVREKLAVLSEQSRGDIFLALLLGKDLPDPNQQEIKNKICGLARVYYQPIYGSNVADIEANARY